MRTAHLAHGAAGGAHRPPEAAGYPAGGALHRQHAGQAGLRHLRYRADAGVKSHRRNDRPVLIAVSTNDALASSAPGIGMLQCRRGFYFVPYGQDDPFAKPQSLKADLALLPAAVDAALRGEQLQPVLLGQRNA